MFIELVLDFFYFLGNDFLEKVLLNLLNVFFVKLVELLFLSFESLQNFTLNDMVSIFLHLPYYHFQLLNLIYLAHRIDVLRIVRLMRNNIGILVDVLNARNGVIMHGEGSGCGNVKRGGF